MRYNFDEPVDRERAYGIKWDRADAIFKGNDLIPMWVADMDFHGPQPVIEAMKRRAEQGLYGYTWRPDSLLEAVAAWVERRHGWTIDKEWICWSPGVIPALSAAVQTYTEPGDRIIVQPPVYPPFFKTVKEHGRELVLNPLRLTDGRYEMDVDLLEQQFKETGAKMLILCSPHNPVGRVWNREELERIEAVCAEHEAMVVSDEIHADLVFRPYRHTPFASLSARAAERTVVCFAPSKTFNMAGLQAGFIVIPDRARRDAFNQAIAKAHHSSSGTFAVTASESAYRDGADWLDQVLEYIRANIDYAIDFLRRNVPELKPVEPEGTYLLWVDCRGLGVDAKSLQQFMIQEARVAFNEGIGFGEEGAGFMRMNAACRRATLEEALRRIHDAVQARRGS
jgi:cystathionine beta-lyase